jgi:SagB-type dehydrogenase family enzyme
MRWRAAKPMNRRLRDLDFLVSAGLLVAVLVTAATGVVADLWDLNDFWYHTLSGYVMGALALAHVGFNWDRLLGYARFRLRSRAATTTPSRATRSDQRRVHPVIAGGNASPADRLGQLAVSRRGLFGLAAGGLGGIVLGRGLRPVPPIPVGSDVGVIYHQWSKPGILDALGSVANWGQAPALYKAYPQAPRVDLPEPRLETGLRTEEAIARRRSVRAYGSRSLSLDELSRVLFLTSGISADRWGNARRTAPSSGALYPVEVYAVVHRVDGLDPGVYHYAYREHALELVRAGDHRQAVVEQGIGQEFLGQCGMVLFLTQILQRMRPKYQDRSYRYGLLEAGHIGENAYLAATSAGLGACGIGAFMDDQVNGMLGVDGVDEAALYMLAVGHTA